MPHRSAKIVCTLGPAVDAPDGVARLAEAGMDVARLNFSHGTHAEHAERAERVRAASRDIQKPIGLLQDLCGPKIRTGRRGPTGLETGGRVRLIAGARAAADALAVDYEHLTRDVARGDRILLADGAIDLRVEAVDPDSLLCRVEHGGALRARMGVNLPSRRLRLSAITDQDRKDLAFGLELGVDLVALSFVRNAAEIAELRQLCAAIDEPPGIVAKIETPAALDDLQAIAQAADALMVARGDLGVELAPESVPAVQKDIIEACRTAGRPVIVATEMLQSMVTAPRPTRAEASDVANAVFDGADAVMLSAETATGDDPARACATMARIIERAESSPYVEYRPSPAGETTAEAIARAACSIASEVRAVCIVALTSSGLTARLVSGARPRVPIIALCPGERTLRRMAAVWGVVPGWVEEATDVESLTRRASDYLRERKLVKKGDSFVIVFGSPLGTRGTTNSIRIERAE